ncbi:hypothetical protein WIW50_16480 [Flavobacteriaceae bacterium 3-367]|uniref:hypothetical protein n=1 Tax=Eudoraea algarum TaxID=3417568 RepID=UPI00327146CD
MKAILTLILVLFFGAIALAQNTTTDGKVATVEMGIVLDAGTVATITFNEVEEADETTIARVYKFKNSRIKKALAFTTKRNKAKLA